MEWVVCESLEKAMHASSVHQQRESSHAFHEYTFRYFLRIFLHKNVAINPILSNDIKKYTREKIHFIYNLKFSFDIQFHSIKIASHF